MNNLIANFIGFEGRLNRQPFWISGIVLSLVSIVISLLILPLIGLGLAPNITNLSTDATPAEIIALVTAAQSKASWVSLVMFAIFVYPSAAICVKRRHDRNSSGLDVWIYFGLTAMSFLFGALGLGVTAQDFGNGMIVPMPGPITMVIGAIVGIFGIYLLVVLCFLKGTAGPNSYGPDPLQG